jgi:polyphosphate kinase
VGQLLEHSRIYAFGTLEDCEVYLSSADLMTRNMDKRIEIAWPMNNPSLRKQIQGYLELCYADTAKLRELLPTGKYTPLGYFATHERAESASALARQVQEESTEAAEGAAGEGTTGEGTVEGVAAEGAAGERACAAINGGSGTQAAAGELFDSQKYLIAEAQHKHLVAAELRARKKAKLTEAAALPLGAPVPGGIGNDEEEAPETEEELEFVEVEATEEAEVAEKAEVEEEAEAAAVSDATEVDGAGAAEVEEAEEAEEAEEVLVAQPVSAQPTTALVPVMPPHKKGFFARLLGIFRRK